MKTHISRASREVINVWIFAGLYAASLLLVMKMNGALGIPRNDDAFYIGSLFQFADNQVFLVQQPNLIGQVILALPLVQLFGNQVAPLQIFNCVIGSISLIACYFTVKTYLNQIGSAIAVMSLAFCPVYINIICSFMTDGMCISFQLFSIYFLTKYVKNKSNPRTLLVAALACSLIAFSIRQFGAISGVVVIAGASYSVFDSETKKYKKFVISASGIYIIIVATGLYWHAKRQHQLTVRSEFQFSFMDLVQFGQSWMATVGIYVIPALVLGVIVLSSRVTNKLVVGLGGLVVAFMGFLIFLRFRTTPVGNYFGKFVAYGGTKRMEIPDLLGNNEYRLLKVLVGLVYILLSVFVYQLIVSKRHRYQDKTLLLHLVFMVFSVAAVFLAVGGFGFDRYHLVVIPFINALILYQIGLDNLVNRINYIPALVFVIIAAVYSYKALDLSSKVDGIAWETTKQLVEDGIDPRQINGSYEWNVFHGLYDGKSADLSNADREFNDWFDPNPSKIGNTDKCFSLQSKPDGKFSVFYKESAVKTLFGQEIVALVYFDPSCE